METRNNLRFHTVAYLLLSVLDPERQGTTRKLMGCHAAQPEKLCGNCGCDDAKFYQMEPSGANGEQQNLCWTCAKYWREHHFPRPDYMIAHQKQKRAST